MHVLCALMFLDLIKRYPAISRMALSELSAALSEGSCDTGINGGKYQAANIKIRKTHKMNGLSAMSPKVRAQT